MVVGLMLMGRNEFSLQGYGKHSALAFFLGSPLQSRHPSVFGSQQNDMVPAVVGADADYFPPIVDRECLEQLPPAARLQELIQVVQAMLTVEKSMKALVALRKRPADDFTAVIDIARDAERSSQSAQCRTLSTLLAESLDTPRILAEENTGQLPAIVDRFHVVAVVVKGPQIHDVECGATGSNRPRCELPRLIHGSPHKGSTTS
jgi:hypothetical protein